jgi:EAL domain-containing protein (putative c-di-GMP-specific phosphodiesterase class I)
VCSSDLLGQWVLHQAVRLLKAWETDSERQAWRISINVSVRQFEDGDCVARMTELLERYRFRPERLCLELTENVLLQHTKEILHKLSRLREMGFQLSIDDFGTGYSSLAYLKRLPITELKIDRSFVHEMTTDSSNAILVQTMIAIGQQFGLEVVAEGVETEAQYEHLLSLGCTRFQGFLFGHPQPLEQFDAT